MDIKFKDSIGFKPLSKQNAQSQQKKKTDNDCLSNHLPPLIFLETNI